MNVHEVGIIMNGVTGRMGKNQHLARSIMAIRQQGGVRINDDETIMPQPILVGRNENRLKALGEQHGVPYSTDLNACLADPKYSIYFDAQTTLRRVESVKRAIAAGKHVYCEKPTAVSASEAVELFRCADTAGVKHGVVQDKLWLPGLLKLKYLIDTGFFGEILSVRGEFGYWVFTGENQPAQRPSWNYRKADGGGIMVDMLCHWRYVIDNLFGAVTAVSCLGATHLKERRDEAGQPYTCDTDDAAYATFETDQGIICQFNSSWCTRVRRDDLLTIHVDGTKGSAVAGLRECVVQHDSATPKPVWNPDIANPIDFFGGWTAMPWNQSFDNAFKVQWELFLRHVALDEPFRWGLLEGAKGIQLAELGLESWAKRAWVNVPPLAS
ncbi:MAG: Gfo/Idh/MocA family oxidoreductase [Candidatus Hydrogenedentes bacterium]|nr:Gfo/Idh/MocA family oxidoreductase [Candidatus Hydrogenedentota bacterium]